MYNFGSYFVNLPNLGKYFSWWSKILAQVLLSLAPGSWANSSTAPDLGLCSCSKCKSDQKLCSCIGCLDCIICSLILGSWLPGPGYSITAHGQYIGLANDFLTANSPRIMACWCIWLLKINTYLYIYYLILYMICTYGQSLFQILIIEEKFNTPIRTGSLNLTYCISHYFRVQLFSRFWTRCGNSRVVNFAIFLMLSLL